MSGAAPGRSDLPLLVPDWPLPEQAYLPGHGPHPRSRPRDADPAGAGFLLWPARDEWLGCRQHRRAIDLFDHGYWWEAHEAWEELWRIAPETSPERLALKALIQAAAALLKRRMQQPAPAERLRQRALLGIEAATSHSLIHGGPCLGLDLIDFASRFDAFLGGASPHPPALAGIPSPPDRPSAR